MNIKKIAFVTLVIGSILYAIPSWAGSCKKQGSSFSVAAITAKYKNCVNCGTQKNGNKTVYYCYCGDGCKGTPASKYKDTTSSSSSKSSSSNTTSSKSSGSCTKQGSHDSINYIKSHYKNCNNCWSEDVAAGKCSKNRNAHKHHYCNCGTRCAGAPKTSSSSNKSSSSNTTSSKSSGSCTKQGSHDSINYIKSHYQNCNSCWSEDVAAGKCSKNKQAHKHYYCNCGTGCAGAPKTSSSNSSSSSSSNTSNKNSNSNTRRCPAGYVNKDGACCKCVERIEVCGGMFCRKGDKTTCQDALTGKKVSAFDGPKSAWAMVNSCCSKISCR